MLIVIRPDGQVMFNVLTTELAEVALTLVPEDDRLVQMRRRRAQPGDIDKDGP